MYQSEQFSRQTDQFGSEYDLPLNRDLAKQLKTIRDNSKNSSKNRLDYNLRVPQLFAENKQNYQTQAINTLQLPVQMAQYKDFRKDNQIHRQNRPLIQRLYPENNKPSIKRRNSQNLEPQTAKSSIKTDSKVYQIRISNQLKEEVSKIYGQMDLKRIQSICSKNNQKKHNQQQNLHKKITSIIKQKNLQRIPIPSSIDRSKSSAKLQKDKNLTGKTKYQQILDQVFNSNEKGKTVSFKRCQSVKSMKTNAQLIMGKFDNQQNSRKQIKMVDRAVITRSIKLQRHFSQANIRQNHKRKVSDSLKPKVNQKQDKNRRNKQIQMVRKVLTQKKNKPKIDYIQYKRSNCYIQQYYDRISKMV